MNSLTIGEVAKRGGVKLPTVRYYERRGLIPEPPRTESGYRAYGVSAVNRIHFIKRAQELGFTLSEIEDLLRLLLSEDVTKAHIKRRTKAKLVEIREKVGLLQQIERHLERLLAACSGRGAVTDCPILEELGFGAYSARSTHPEKAGT